MDVATHFLVPYAAALVALGSWRSGVAPDPRKVALALAFGLGGVAPDLDGVLTPLVRAYDGLWFLQHRGLSHTLVGAPLFALLLVGALALLARRLPGRLAPFAWRPGFAGAAVLGSFTHLLLDAVTLAGVPLWWPFAFGRVSLQHFGWLVFWLFPLGVVVLALHAAGRLSHANIARAGALVVAALVLVAGVRVATRPEDLPEDALVFPSSDDRTWIVLRPRADGGWDAHLRRGDEAFAERAFPHDVPSEAEEAVRAAQSTASYRGFLLGSYGPVTIVAERSDGAWNVSFVDVAQRMYASNAPAWTPTRPHEDWGLLAFRVDAERVEVVHRGW